MSEKSITLTESELRDLLVRSAKKMYEQAFEKNLSQSAKELAREICRKNPEECVSKSEDSKKTRPKKYTKENLKGKKVPALREIADELGIKLGSTYIKKEELVKKIVRKDRKLRRTARESAKPKATPEESPKETEPEEKTKSEAVPEEKPESLPKESPETFELEFANSEAEGDSEDEPLDLDKAKKFLEDKIVNETDITKEDFAKFLVIEKKGKTKMDQPEDVAKASGLTKVMVEAIIKNRTSLEKKYPDLVKKKKENVFARRR